MLRPKSEQENVECLGNPDNECFHCFRPRFHCKFIGFHCKFIGFHCKFNVFDPALTWHRQWERHREWHISGRARILARPPHVPGLLSPSFGRCITNSAPLHHYLYRENRPIFAANRLYFHVACWAHTYFFHIVSMKHTNLSLSEFQTHS